MGIEAIVAPKGVLVEDKEVKVSTCRSYRYLSCLNCSSCACDNAISDSVASSPCS